MSRLIENLFRPFVDGLKAILNFMIALRQQKRKDFEALIERYDDMLSKQNKRISKLEQKLEEQASRIDHLQETIANITPHSMSLMSMPWPAWVNLIKEDEEIIVLRNSSYKDFFEALDDPFGNSVERVHGRDLAEAFRELDQDVLRDGKGKIFLLRVNAKKRGEVDIAVLKWPINGKADAVLVGGIALPINDDLCQLIKKFIEQ